MSRWAVVLIYLFPVAAWTASKSLRQLLRASFHCAPTRITNVEGLQERIHDGKLVLHIRDFLELVLLNSTDIRLTRLQPFTAADQITAAKAPFDPSLIAGFNALRSVSPLFFQSGGSAIPISGTGGSAGEGNSNSSAVSGTGAATGGIINLPQTIDSLSQNSLLQYSQLLPTGQTISSSFSANRSSGNSYTYPIIFGNLNFSLTQPLLQNRTNLQFRAPLQAARTQLIITSEQSEAAIGTALATAARQYWAAIQARGNIQVQKWRWTWRANRMSATGWRCNWARFPSWTFINRRPKWPSVNAIWCRRSIRTGLRLTVSGR